MPSYLCYFLDRSERIAGPSEVIDADTLESAIEQALAMLAARPHYQTVELWEGARRLYPAPHSETSG